MTERVEPADFAPWSDGGDLSGFQWYRTLVDTVAEGVFQLDADDRIIAIDDTLLELTGYDREVIRGEHISQLVGGFGTDALGGDENGSGGDGDADSDPGSDGDGDADTDRNAGTDGDEGRDGTQRAMTRARRHLDRGSNPDGRWHRNSLRTTPRDGACRQRPARDGRRRSRPRVATVRGRVAGGIGDGREHRPAGRAGRGVRVRLVSLVRIDYCSARGADVGVFVLDEAFDVAWVNDAIERYFGLDSTAVVDRDKRELQMRSSPSGSAIRIDSSRRSVRPTMTTATPNDSTVT